MAEKKLKETQSEKTTSDKKEAKKEVKTEAKKETKAPVKTVKAVKPVKPAKKAEVKDEDKVYHISRRKTDHMWYVKAEGSPRALKKFFTQEEAVAYAKTVAGNNEGRIVIHKVDGSFKKLKY